MELKKENGAVDIAKIIMALLVVVIHKPIFNSDFLNYISGSVICSVAVPFFFAASSYFFFNKIDKGNDDNKSLLSFEKRLFKLYLIWTLIYLPCLFVKYNTGHYEDLSIKIFLGQMILTVKNFFLSTSFVHLWYVNALMLSVAVIYLLYRKLNYKVVFIICILIALLARIILVFCSEKSLLGTLYGYIPTVLKNSFERGILCSSCGFFLNKSSKCKSRNEIKYGVVMTIASLLALIAVGVLNFISDNDALEFLLPFLAFANAAALLSVCLRVELKPSKVYVALRKYSTLIYFSHLIMMSDLFRFISFKTGITAFTDNRPLIYFITVGFAVLISTLVIWLSEKEKFKFLRNLY